MKFNGQNMVTVEAAAEALGMTVEELIALSEKESIPLQKVTVYEAQCPSCGNTVQGSTSEFIATCLFCECQGRYIPTGKGMYGVEILKPAIDRGAQALKEANRITELKKARDDGGELLEFMCQAFNTNPEGIKQGLIKQAHEDPRFREKMIQSAKDDEERWMEEHKIPAQDSPEGRRYSLAHILDAYGISPLKFCENFGLHYKALLESGMTYFMTIEEMWDRDIYPVYLKKAAQQ